MYLFTNTFSYFPDYIWMKRITPTQVKQYRTSSIRLLNETDGNRELNFDETESAEDEVVENILNAALTFVPDYGWSKEALAAGAKSIGLSRAAHGLLENGGGNLVLHFYGRCNSELEKQLQADQPLKTNERTFVINAVRSRLMMINPYINHWPQAMAILSMPPNIAPAFRHLTYLVDTIWHFAGDKSLSTDWYTKRATLAAIYKSTELFFIQDESPDFQDTWSFLDNRIQNVESLSKNWTQVKYSGTIVKGLFTTMLNIVGIQNTNR